MRLQRAEGEERAEGGIIGRMPMPLWDFAFDEAGAFIFGG